MQKPVSFKYTAKSNDPLVISFLQAIGSVKTHREMIFQLFKREFVAKFKRSILGAGWILVAPVAGIVSWLFLHFAQVVLPGDTGVPYPLYVLVGTLFWGLFMNIFSSTSYAMMSYRHLICYIKFPHFVIFVTEMCVEIANFLISFLLIGAVLIVSGQYPSLGILLLPVYLLPLILAAFAIGLFSSLLAVVSYDLNRFLKWVVGLLLYVTPVIYTQERITQPLINTLVACNPLTYVITAARENLLYGKITFNEGWMVSSLAVLLVFFISWRIFHLTENRIIERIL